MIGEPYYTLAFLVIVFIVGASILYTIHEIEQGEK
jgi:hypothetical protein